MPSFPRLRLKEYFRDARAHVAVVRQKGQSEMGPHNHEFVELVIILGGEGLHQTGIETHALQAGDAMVINGSRQHAYKDTRSLNLVNVLIREEVLRKVEGDFGQLPGYHALFTMESMRWRSEGFPNRLRLNPADLRQVSAWVDALEEETLRPREGGHLLAHAWLMLIIGLLVRRHGLGAEDSPDIPMRLGRVLSRMEIFSSGTLRLPELAREAAMSERTFLRKFREATGCSPIDYLLRSRIRRAAELLAHRGSRFSLTEIAGRCGFEDSNYFSRQFRKVMGVSPRSYRNRL